MEIFIKEIERMMNNQVKVSILIGKKERFAKGCLRAMR